MIFKALYYTTEGSSKTPAKVYMYFAKRVLHIFGNSKLYYLDKHPIQTPNPTVSCKMKCKMFSQSCYAWGLWRQWELTAWLWPRVLCAHLKLAHKMLFAFVYMQRNWPVSLAKRRQNLGTNTAAPSRIPTVITDTKLEAMRGGRFD